MASPSDHPEPENTEDSDAPEEPGAEERSRSSIPPDAARSFRRLERMIPEMLRKGLEKGIEAGLSSWEKNLETALGKTEAVQGVVREALADGKLPRELASAFFQQIEDTKNGVLRVVAREFRDFLEATDLSNELKKALTSLSFEIRTEVRFIPNDAGVGVRPQVRAAGRVKQAGASGGRRRSRRPPAPDEDIEEAEDEAEEAAETSASRRSERPSRSSWLNFNDDK